MGDMQAIERARIGFGVQVLQVPRLLVGQLRLRDLAEARDVVSRYLADGVAVLVEERVAMRR